MKGWVDFARSSPIIFDAPSHCYDALPLLGVGRVVVGGDGLEHSPAKRDRHSSDFGLGK